MRQRNEEPHLLIKPRNKEEEKMLREFLDLCRKTGNDPLDAIFLAINDWNARLRFLVNTYPERRTAQR